MESNQEELLEAIYLGNVEEARRILLCNPQLVSSQDGNGNQPMHIAVLQNNIDMAKILVEFDAPIGRRNYDGLTVKGVARMSDRSNMISLIDSHYSIDNNRCGKEPEKHYYHRTNLKSIPSQAILREEATRLKILTELNEWKNLERSCCARRIQKQVRRFLVNQACNRYKSANIIQTVWRSRCRKKANVQQQRAAILLQSIERMRVAYMKYIYFDRERLIIYRNTRILALVLQRVWRGHKGRSLARRLKEISTLPDPSMSKNYYFWLEMQTNSNPPVRTYGIWNESVLSGYPRSWEERNRIKRNGYFRDVKFYTNSITRKVTWEQPIHWKEADLNSLRQRLTIFRLGFTMEQNKTASMLQSLWKAKVARRYLNILLKANRIMLKAREEYESNPNSMTALVNYTLFFQAKYFDDKILESLYDQCLNRMVKRGGDNSVILFGYAIFCAKKGDNEYERYLVRARVAEERRMKRRPGSHSFDLANAYFRFISNSVPCFEALQNYCICRLLVYGDIEGSKIALHQAIGVCRSNETNRNLIDLFSRLGFRM